MIKTFDLFAGIGGFRIASELAFKKTKLKIKQSVGQKLISTVRSLMVLTLILMMNILLTILKK